MAQAIDDEIWCCTDCLMIVANDDASGMDDETEARCRDGIHAMQEDNQGYLVCNTGDGEEGHQTFSHSRCEVCGALPGERHRLALLK